MKKKFDIVVKTGSYTDSFGEEKGRWLKIGTVIEKEQGMRIKLDAIPLNWDGWASLMEPKVKQEVLQDRSRAEARDLDDIPF